MTDLDRIVLNKIAEVDGVCWPGGALCYKCPFFGRVCLAHEVVERKSWAMEMLAKDAMEDMLKGKV